MITLCVRVCDEGMDVKALGVGMRGANSVIIPNRGDHLECEECGMCIDICPVGALTSGTYRYKTRPWEMKYVGTVCAHCSNGCKTTLSVRNNEILRANNRDLSGINGDFLCVKGRFGFDFARHPDRLKQPLVRRNAKLEPASWEDALLEVAGRLKQVRENYGPGAVGFIGSNRTSNEENYLLGRLARAAVGTNNLDHHRTADYAGLVAALGAQLYAINARAIKLRRQARQFVQTTEGSEPAVMRWLASGKGNLEAGVTAGLTALKAALEKESDVVIVFGPEVTGAAIRDLMAFGSRLAGQTRYMALGDYANSRGASDTGSLPERLPGYASIDDSAAREFFGKLWGAPLPEKPGLNARQMLDAAL